MNNLIRQIKKRDGRVVDFNPLNIKKAINKASQATKTPVDIERVYEYTIKTLEEKFNDKIASVEDIQNEVEKALIHFDYPDTAKAYIIYRQVRNNEREGKYLVDIISLIDDYIEQKDWRVKENANASYSVSGLTFHIAGSVIANYSLYKYPKHIGHAHRNGDIHVHDLSFGLICGYCAGWDLEKLFLEGINDIPGKINSNPANHLTSATWQMINFIGTLQNEWAGAQAFNSVDTLLAPFVRKDQLTYKQVRQAMQGLIFNLNVPSRWANQTPFSNFTFDWTIPDDRKDDIPVIGGKPMDFAYGDLQEESLMINKAFMEVLTNGDARGSTFTFPIPTINITKEFDWNGPMTDELFALTAKYGPYYFANFVNSELDPKDIRSMCCRLSLNLKELKNKMGGLFGAGSQTGSIAVTTINLPRIGYLSRDDNEFFSRLDNMLDIAKEAMEIKRTVIKKNLERGLMPYTRRYLGHFNGHFSTIGIIGMNECLINYMDKGIWDKEAYNFGIGIMDHIRSKLLEIQNETGNLYNLEATPAEGTTRRLAAKDKKHYPDIIVANEQKWRENKAVPYYTNSIHLPVGFTNDIFESLDLEEEFLTKFTGGCVKHIYLGERLPSADSARNLVKKVCSNYRVPYISVTPSFSVCPTHGYVNGAHDTCPKEI